MKSVIPRASPKSIIISHVYSSDNKGDAALTSVLIKDLKQKFPLAAITILKLDATLGSTRFEGVPQEPSFMYYALNKYRGSLPKLIYTIYMMSVTLIWAAVGRHMRTKVYLPKHLRAIAEMYDNTDLIVPVGGGYMRSRKGLLNRLNIPLLLHPLLISSLLGKPTVMYAQSVGPFQNRFEEALVAFVLKRMTLIMLREDTSMSLLADLHVTDNVVRAIDSGFLLKSKGKVDLRQRYHIPADKMIIGVTVRAWLKDDAQVVYERAVAATLDNMVKYGNAHILFIPQVTAAQGDDDRVVSQRVHGYMHSKAAATMIVGEPDHHRIKAIYDGLDVLLGTRFHSVIFSLTSFVPVVAIEYEHKTSGIMRDLALERWVVNIEDVTAGKLTRMLRKLVLEQTRYRAHLHDCLPAYLHQANQAKELLARAYIESV